jgi:hypothetical protein
MGFYPHISYPPKRSLLDNHIRDAYTAHMALHALLYELDFHHEFHHHVGLGLALALHFIP